MASSPLTREEVAAEVRTTLGSRSAHEANALSNPGADRGRIVAVYLYGSYARGTARADSDVDLGLLYAPPPLPELLAQPFLIEAVLCEQLGRRVQCVVMNTAPADLVHRMFMDGVLLLDVNPAYRIRFEVDARNRYFDLKPMLDHYRSARRVA
jgi:uncharacterized protein